jgi:myo-inositol catabolism protein IolS
MKYRRLGKTDLEVSEISLGCWTLGGKNWVEGHMNGWADVDEDEAVAGLKLAVDRGVNHFDNADVYGNGRAERMLARALKKLGLRSEDYIVATKVGHFRGTAEHAYDPLHIRHQLEQSLKNLQRDYVDIYYLHHGDFGPRGEWLEGAAATLEELVREGKVRVKGQSAYTAEDFARAVPVVRPAVLQSIGNLLRPDFFLPDSPVGRLLEEGEMSFVAFSPLHQGILLGKYDPQSPPIFEPGDIRKQDPKFQGPELKRLKPLLEALKSRFGAEPARLAAVAMRYVLNHPRVACVIPGFRNAHQTEQNLTTEEQSLNEADMNWIRNEVAKLIS